MSLEKKNRRSPQKARPNEKSPVTKKSNGPRKVSMLNRRYNEVRSKQGDCMPAARNEEMKLNKNAVREEKRIKERKGIKIAATRCIKKAHS
jgi:hypothetical protein